MSTQVPVAVAIGDAAIFQYVQNESVLLDMATQQYFALDEVGTEMWRLLLENGSTAAVLDRLCAIYDADRATLSRDLEVLVRKLVDAGLLKPAASQNSCGS